MLGDTLSQDRLDGADGTELGDLQNPQSCRQAGLTGRRETAMFSIAPPPARHRCFRQRAMKEFGRCRGTRSPASPAAAHHPRATGQDHRCLYLADAILHAFPVRTLRLVMVGSPRRSVEPSAVLRNGHAARKSARSPKSGQPLSPFSQAVGLVYARRAGGLHKRGLLI